MSFKLILVLVAFALIASTANASMMLDRLDAFLVSPSLDTFIKLVFTQLWGFFAPFVAGPLEVVLKYVWDNGAISLTYDGGSVTVTYPAALGFVGVGNFD